MPQPFPLKAVEVLVFVDCFGALPLAMTARLAFKRQRLTAGKVWICAGASRRYAQTPQLRPVALARNDGWFAYFVPLGFKDFIRPLVLFAHPL